MRGLEKEKRYGNSDVYKRQPVDSSEMAFLMAAKLAYKAAMPEAGPVLLEPSHTLKAHVPNDNTGDIMGDVTKRRGRVLGMEPDEDGKIGRAHV